jgi:hypothetical protein
VIPARAVDLLHERSTDFPEQKAHLPSPRRRWDSGEIFLPYKKVNPALYQCQLVQ